jgi:hypothetical protein
VSIVSEQDSIALGSCIRPTGETLHGDCGSAKTVSDEDPTGLLLASGSQ